MFVINGDNSIYVTRGDMAFINLSLEKNGVPYIFQIGDKVSFNVCQKNNCSKVLLHKEIFVTSETEQVEIILQERDTKIGDVISKPTDYWYEIVLNEQSDPTTIIGFDEDGPKVFRLYPEANV